MALEGSERKLLHAIVREQGNAQAGYVEDSKIAEIAYLSIEEVRDCLATLEEKECVQRSIGVGGHSAYITAKGRQELRRSQDNFDDERAERPLKIVAGNPVSVHHSGGNPVSVHHSGEIRGEIRCQFIILAREIRCQFIILARKDEPTPDYALARKDEPTPNYALDTGLRACPKR
jgi:hypothetical protein